jgi:hypothetical protein
MNPNDLRARVEAAIVAEIEPVAWERYVRADAVELESMVATMSTWNSISGLVSPPPAADHSRVKLGASLWYGSGGVAPTVMPR